MEIDGFVELGDFYVSVHAQKKATARWTAWARFERMADFKDMKTHIPGMRRRVPNDFPSQEKAVEAAYDFARELVKSGDIGL